MQVDQLSKQELELLIEGLEYVPGINEEHKDKLLEAIIPVFLKKETDEIKTEIKNKHDELRKIVEKRKEEVSLLKAKLINAKRDLA